MRRFYIGAAVVSLALGGSTACATKGYVQQQVTEVNNKVETLSKSVEETQERTRANETKIGEVDQKAGTAQSSANRAQQSASEADAKAGAAGAKADELDKASRKLIYTVVINDEQGNFKFDKAELPDAAKAKIDEMVQQIKSNPQNVFFEIEGYTDSTGSRAYNEKLGLERAEAVKKYLYEQHQIPLHKISVISYGPDKPVAPNTTRAGRAQNRRVVIKVLA